MGRTCPRTVYHSPIALAQTREGAYIPGRIRDYSPNGLCWETGGVLESAKPVFILTRRYTPGAFGPEAFRSYVAVIKWCKAEKTDQHECFLAGGQITLRSHGLFEETHDPCGLCGNLHPRELILTTPSSLTVCHACAKHLEGLSSQVLSRIRHFVR